MKTILQTLLEPRTRAVLKSRTSALTEVTAGRARRFANIQVSTSSRQFRTRGRGGVFIAAFPQPAKGLCAIPAGAIE